MADRDPKAGEVDVDELRDYVLRPLRQLWRVGLPARTTTFFRDTARFAGDFVAQLFDTTRAYRPEQPVEDVPVMFPGGDGYGFYFDLAPDDPCFLVAGDAEHRGFWETGETVSPTTGQAHSYGCAVAFPGGRISSSVLGQSTPAPNAAGEAVLGARDATATVRLRRARADAVPPEAGTVVVEAAGPLASLLLGSATAAEPPALAVPLLTNLLDLNTKIQAIPVTGVPPTDAAITAVKGAFAAWVLALQPFADAKVRLDGVGP